MLVYPFFSFFFSFLGVVIVFSWFSCCFLFFFYGCHHLLLLSTQKLVLLFGYWFCFVFQLNCSCFVLSIAHKVTTTIIKWQFNLGQQTEIK